MEGRKLAFGKAHSHPGRESQANGTEESGRKQEENKGSPHDNFHCDGTNDGMGKTLNRETEFPLGLEMLQGICWWRPSSEGKVDPGDQEILHREEMNGSLAEGGTSCIQGCHTQADRLLLELHPGLSP